METVHSKILKAIDELNKSKDKFTSDFYIKYRKFNE
jgi:hypothetical protein